MLDPEHARRLAEHHVRDHEEHLVAFGDPEPVAAMGYLRPPLDGLTEAELDRLWYVPLRARRPLSIGGTHYILLDPDTGDVARFDRMPE